MIDNKIITKVPSAKYLGVILDEDLTWEEHIENLNKSLTKTRNSFKIIKEIEYIRVTNLSCTMPTYRIEVYGRANMTALKKVQTQQNRSLKILYNKDDMISHQL